MTALSGKTVLVTGSDGFIGSHVVERLLADGRATCAPSASTTRTARPAGSTTRTVPRRRPGSRGRARRHPRPRARAAAVDGRRRRLPPRRADRDPLLATSRPAPTSRRTSSARSTCWRPCGARRAADGQHLDSRGLRHPGDVPITESHPLRGQSPYSATKIARGQDLRVLRPVLRHARSRSCGRSTPSGRASRPAPSSRPSCRSCWPARTSPARRRRPRARLHLRHRHRRRLRPRGRRRPRAGHRRPARHRAHGLDRRGRRAVPQRHRHRRRDRHRRAADAPGRAPRCEILLSDPSLAQRLLGWTPTVSLEEGLAATAEWLRPRVDPTTGRAVPPMTGTQRRRAAIPLAVPDIGDARAPLRRSRPSSPASSRRSGRSSPSSSTASPPRSASKHAIACATGTAAHPHRPHAAGRRSRRRGGLLRLHLRRVGQPDRLPRGRRRARRQRDARPGTSTRPCSPASSTGARRAGERCRRPSRSCTCSASRPTWSRCRRLRPARHPRARGRRRVARCRLVDRPVAGRHTGAVGPVGRFSFNGNKIATTGGGGMIVTDDDGLAARARHLTTQAKVPDVGYLHDEVGYNYRLTNLAAAWARPAERLAEFVDGQAPHRRRLRRGARRRRPGPAAAGESSTRPTGSTPCSCPTAPRRPAATGARAPVRRRDPGAVAVAAAAPAAALRRGPALGGAVGERPLRARRLAAVLHRP